MSVKEFKLPDPGEGQTEAEIVTWMVKAGDTVKVNDIVVEIETAKSLVELPVPFAGTVTQLLVSEGETVEVGTPIIAVDTTGGAATIVQEAPSAGAVEPGIEGSPAPKLAAAAAAHRDPATGQDCPGDGLLPSSAATTTGGYVPTAVGRPCPQCGRAMQRSRLLRDQASARREVAAVSAMGSSCLGPVLSIPVGLFMGLITGSAGVALVAFLVVLLGGWLVGLYFGASSFKKQWLCPSCHSGVLEDMRRGRA